MEVLLLDALSEAPSGDNTLILGWCAIAGAWCAFGSFAVPMKSPAVMEAKVHPLIFQCYKTFWTFVTSHFVLIFQPYVVSPWGIASGFSWVPAGIAAVVAVQNVGIACGQAVWQVTIIVTSFIWGFFILKDEEVVNIWGTVLSVGALCLGVVGMTLAFNLKTRDDADPVNDSASFGPMGLSLQVHESKDRAADVVRKESAETEPPPSPGRHRSTTEGDVEDVEERRPAGRTRPRANSAPVVTALAMATTVASLGVSGDYELKRKRSRSALTDIKYSVDDLVTERRASMALGIGAALFNGIWGGASLVPSHYAPLHGVEFTLSFAWGALIANVVIFTVYCFLCKRVWHCDIPSFQVKTMAVPGFISGTLWSIGNFCSLYAVNSMGQGIGYSLIQSSVIVSGCWGIFYYRELSGRPIVFWFAWMLVAVAGVLGLAAEKK